MTDYVSCTARRRVALLLLALVLFSAACSTDATNGDNVVSASATTLAAEPGAPAATSGPATNDGEASDPDDSDPEQEACDVMTSEVDMWEGLDGQPFEIARQRTNVLLDSNPESCKPFVQIESGIDAAALGALAVRSVEHADPYVRYDLFVFESREVADELGAREVASAALASVLPDDSTVDVFRVGATLFVAESYTDDGSGRPPREVRGILDYYGQLISGFE